MCLCQSPSPEVIHHINYLLTCCANLTSVVYSGTLVTTSINTVTKPIYSANIRQGFYHARLSQNTNKRKIIFLNAAKCKVLGR